MAGKFYGQDLKEAHALAIGKIVMAWNEYQDQLGQIFAALFGARNWALALAAWNALENDRAQRSMLVEVTKAKMKVDSKAYKEIKWMVDITNDMIADQRNTGIHMPLMSYTDLKGVHQILPLAMFGNRRVTKMVGRDLLREYAHYEAQIRKMYGFAVAIDFKLSPRRKGRANWPTRPQLSGKKR